jgi:hypothetical protein
MRNSKGRNWNMARNTEKCAKGETLIVGPEIWRERVKKNEK